MSLAKVRLKLIRIKYYERLKNIKENTAQEIDHMDDHQREGVETQTRLFAEILQDLRDIDSVLD